LLDWRLILFLSVAEVDDFDVVVLVEHDVLRLQVAVHDQQLLHVLEDVHELGCVQAHHADVQLPSFLDQSRQVAPYAVFKDKVEICLIFSRPEELDNERMVHLVEKVTLAEDMPRFA